MLGVLPERMMSIPTGRVRHRPLEDFERLYVGVGAENYGWYQLMLTAAAKKIYEAAGADGLRAVPDFCNTRRRLDRCTAGAAPRGASAPQAARLVRSWPM